METRDAERLAKLTKEVVELGVTLALVPLRMLLRHLLPGQIPADRQRWAPVVDGDAPAAPSTPVATAARMSTSTPAAPSPHASDLTGADAARLREAEREAESTPDGPGPELHVAAPWPGYDAMTVGDVLDRLTGADPTTRAMVRLYEETHKNRKGVLRATE